MGSTFADELFQLGIPESKKFELIYRRGPSLSAGDLEQTIERLRADCRYARLLGALIDASKNEKLAIEELFSGNAVSVKIVASYRWLYTTESRGFISEDFVRNTLPSASVSSQKQIVNKISKWVSNTDLGDKLWLIVHGRSPKLCTMLLGACSNDLIMKELHKDEECLSVSQMLDILRKRFDSGIELIKRMAEAQKLSSSPINTKEIFHHILKQDFEKGMELLIAIKSPVRLGRHFTRKLLESTSENESRLSTLLKWVEQVKQRVLARHAPADVYLKCFLTKFNEEVRGDMRDGSRRLQWLRHLRDDAKQRALETWYETVQGSTLIDSFEKVPEEFLSLLDEGTLREVVTRRIALASRSDKYSEEDVRIWQSMIPDDEDCFTKQKERLKGEKSDIARQRIYLSILESVFTLRRPQYLERRLRFLVKRTRNDYDSQEELLTRIRIAILKDHRFTINDEIWPHVKEFIDLQLFLRNEYMDRIYRDVLLVALEKVSLNQTTLLAEIMEELNKVQVLRAHENYDIRVLSREKRRFFWNGALAYRESLEDTRLATDREVCPGHLQAFYLALAEGWEDNKDLIKSYPRTMKVLKFIVGPEMSFEKFPKLSIEDVRSIYRMLEPLLSPDEAISQDLRDLIQKEKAKMKKKEVLEAFRKSKVTTEELRALYPDECLHRHFVQACGRSLLHAEAEHLSKWLVMLDDYIEQNSKGTGVTNTYNLKAMISCPAKFRDEVARLYPTEAKFDLSKGESESREVLKRINVLKSLRHFNDSGLAFEMTLCFMKGDYLKETLASFNRHRSRLPVAKVTTLLRESILRKDSAVSARKIILQGVLSDALLFEGNEIIDILKKLSVKEEHDNIKNEALTAILNIVKQVGEEKGWPILEVCIDSIVLDDRACVHTLVTDGSIDEHIPAHIEHLMQKVVEFCGAETYAKEHGRNKLSRIASNVKMLPLNFLLPIIEEEKSLDWSRGIQMTLAINILSHFVPKQAEELRSHFVTFGQDEFSDLKNTTELIELVTRKCIDNTIENASEVLDFLIVALETRSSKDLKELCLLKLTKQMLPLLPEERKDDDLRAKLPAITRTALRVTASCLEEFGHEIHELLEDNLKIVLRASFPRMQWDSQWCKYFLDEFDVDMSPMETLTLLKVIDWCRREDVWIAELKELYSKTKDERVRAVMREKIRQW